MKDIDPASDYCRALLENVLDIVSVLDAAGAIRYESPSVERILGYAPGELAGQDAFALIHPDDRERARAALAAALERPGSAQSAEIRCLHKDGSWRVLEAQGKAIPLEGGSPGVVVNSRDITERRRAEAQVLFQASLLDHVRNAVIATDPEGRITYWNRFAERTYGWTSIEAVGRRLADTIIPPGRRKEFEHKMAELRETSHLEGDFLHRRKDRSTFPASTAVSAIRGPEGRLLGLVGVCVDVSDRVRAEAELRSSREQLRRLADRLESVRETERRLLAREIHDQVGQMLTALRLDLSEVARDVAGGRAVEAVLDRLRRAGDLIDGTIESVQRLSTELRPSLLDELGLAAALEWQAQEFQARTGVQCVLDQPLEDGGVSPTVATAIFRIFQEALTNVARHAHASRVRVSLRRRNRNRVLEIDDDGRGITGRDLVNPRSLGLLGMRERARLLGGDVSIEGTPGKGTRVTLRIPAVRRSSRAPERIIHS